MRCKEDVSIAERCKYSNRIVWHCLAVQDFNTYSLQVRSISYSACPFSPSAVERWFVQNSERKVYVAMDPDVIPPITCRCAKSAARRWSHRLASRPTISPRSTLHECSYWGWGKMAPVKYALRHADLLGTLSLNTREEKATRNSSYSIPGLRTLGMKLNPFLKALSFAIYVTFACCTIAGINIQEADPIVLQRSFKS